MSSTAAVDVVGGLDHHEHPAALHGVPAPVGTVAVAAPEGVNALHGALFLSLILGVQVAWLAVIAYGAWLLLF